MLATVVVLMLIPFLWMVSIAFTPENDVFGSAALVPAHPTIDNFTTALVDGNLLRATFNSLVITVIAVAANCLAAPAAGYAFAMLPFRGSAVLFYLLISTAAVPASVTLIPLFLMAKGFPLAGGNNIGGSGGHGLLDSLGGVLLPYLVFPMNIFLSRQYFRTASRDLGEAARIDGAGEWRVFWRIHLPLARPLVTVVAIFSFTAVWDDFLWPLVVASSPQSQTVQVALTTFLSNGNVRYGPLMAGAVLAVLPVIAVFIVNQRGFVAGLIAGGVKG
jgi:multiple sugar transport system permease protein